ncbi:ATP-grasp domain-containing protein [Pelagovum pacificum]|uniref:ATP-grasp domain-containing protein n=1 Tax=Pelagovum pacificum TaxID=2588711 RepID=A0A5C5GB32_9RHOB|nr:ATP-grasp domain-containing protein [Pelagovum pacificum]QQA42096.1 ATP-grasp domain-containing protein [Pelagovum pacificum]TNY31184.1 ATP-grasp domain-containing protein [Pelagovum pacificum]
MPATVLITGARAPVALHLARLLATAGCRVILADSLRFPLSGSSALVARYVRLPAPRDDPDLFAVALAELLTSERIDLVIPTCEEVLHLARAWSETAMPAVLFAPPLHLLSEVHDKYRFIERARALGLAVPETVLLSSDADLDAVRHRAHDLVFKPVWSRFATRTRVRPAPTALRIRPTEAAPWVAQDYLAGREISAYAIANGGQLSALSVYHVPFRAGRGAGVCFAPVEVPAVRSFVERFVAGTGWTGQVSFDFIETAEGGVLPLECNPRATSGLHFFSDGAAVLSAILGQAFATPDVTGPLGVRLALALYGGPAALRHGRLSDFRQMWRETADVLDWPGDPRPGRLQWRALAEIAAIAARNGISLQAASTRDIEWNGPEG